MLKKIVLISASVFLFATSAFAAFPIDFKNELLIKTAPLTLPLSNGNALTVELAPYSPKPMRQFKIVFKFKEPKAVYSVEFTTNMEMYMGRYEYAIKSDTQGVFQKELTLPKCGSGRSRWYGKITINYTNAMKEERYIFYDVK